MFCRNLAFYGTSDVFLTSRNPNLQFYIETLPTSKISKSSTSSRGLQIGQSQHLSPVRILLHELGTRYVLSANAQLIRSESSAETINWDSETGQLQVDGKKYAKSNTQDGEFLDRGVSGISRFFSWKDLNFVAPPKRNLSHSKEPHRNLQHRSSDKTSPTSLFGT